MEPSNLLLGPLAQQTSYLVWMYQALGIRHSFLLPASAILAFVLVLLVVLKGKDSTIGPCLVLIVPLPLLVGMYAMFDGLVASFQVLSASQVAPKPAEIFEGLAMSSVAPFLGMFLALPSYFAAVLGLLIRTLGPERPSKAGL